MLSVEQELLTSVRLDVLCGSGVPQDAYAEVHIGSSLPANVTNHTCKIQGGDVALLSHLPASGAKPTTK